MAKRHRNLDFPVLSPEVDEDGNDLDCAPNPEILN